MPWQRLTLKSACDKSLHLVKSFKAGTRNRLLIVSAGFFPVSWTAQALQNSNTGLSSKPSLYGAAGLGQIMVPVMVSKLVR